MPRRKRSQIEDVEEQTSRPSKKRRKVTKRKSKDKHDEDSNVSSKSNNKQETSTTTIPDFDGLKCVGFVHKKWRVDDWRYEEVPVFEGPLVTPQDIAYTIWEQVEGKINSNEPNRCFNVHAQPASGCINGVYPNGDKLLFYRQLRAPYFDCFRFRHYPKSKCGDSEFGNYIAYSSDQKFAVKLHGSHQDDIGGQFTAIAEWFRILMEDGKERFVKAYRWSNASIQLLLRDLGGLPQAETSICGTIEGLDDDLQLIQVGALTEKEAYMSDKTPKKIWPDVGNLSITKKYWMILSAKRGVTYKRLKDYELEVNS